MNRVEKIDNQKWLVICENGERFECGEIYEKKTGKFHVKLPKENPTGRTYIRVDKIVDDVYEFETKTEHRENIGWKDRMTDEEKKIWKECEEQMEKIKKSCQERKPVKVEKDSVEYLMKEIARLQEKLNKKNSL